MTSSTSNPAATNLIIKLSQPEQVSFTDTWYDLVNGQHFWMEWRLLALKNMLKQFSINPNIALNVLEIGGGHGILRKQLEEFANWTVDNAELNLYALSHCPAGKGRLLCYNIMEKRPDMKEKYDIVLLFDVIEHIKDTQPFLDAAMFHLRPGGWLIINVPALQKYYSGYDQCVGHFRRYSHTQLIAAMAHLNPETTHTRYWGLLMMPLLIARSITQPVKPGTSHDHSHDDVKQGIMPMNSLTNEILRWCGRLESAIFQSGTLTGTSVLGLFKKQLS